MHLHMCKSTVNITCTHVILLQRRGPRSHLPLVGCGGDHLSTLRSHRLSTGRYAHRTHCSIDRQVREPGPSGVSLLVVSIIDRERNMQFFNHVRQDLARKKPGDTQKG